MFLSFFKKICSAFRLLFNTQQFSNDTLASVNSVFYVEIKYKDYYTAYHLTKSNKTCKSLNVVVPVRKSRVCHDLTDYLCHRILKIISQQRNNH